MSKISKSKLIHLAPIWGQNKTELKKVVTRFQKQIICFKIQIHCFKNTNSML